MAYASPSERTAPVGGRDWDAMATKAVSGGTRLALILLVVSLFIPASFDLAGMNLSVNRLYVLTIVLPLFFAWLGGRGGGVTGPDKLIFMHGVWMVVSLVVIHGMAQFPYSSMTAVEMFGGYLAGRLLIRDASAYKALFATFLLALLVLFPFAVYELKTGRAIMQDFSRALLGSSHNDVEHPLRWGLNRVQSAIQHPILWGVLCSFAVANSFYIWRDRIFSAFGRMGLAVFMTFTSLSSGALLAAMLQFCLMIWDKVTRGNWKLFAILFVSVYVFLSVASNRGPVVLLVETLTFNSGTGWTRIHIWNHTIDDTLANPIFGIGLNDWSRPGWLTASVDNFWAVMGLRHGVVGFLFLAVGILWHMWRVGQQTDLSLYERRLRTGYMITLGGMLFSLATVHVWGPPYVFLMMYIGAGSWFYTVDRSGRSADAPDDEAAADVSRGPVHARPALKSSLSRPREAAPPRETPRGPGSPYARRFDGEGAAGRTRGQMK